jgi:predicted membrane metal-binding protein
VRVHLAAEHALELEAADLLLQPRGVLLDIARRGFIAFALGQLEQLGGVIDALGGAIDVRQVGREACPFLAELLRAIRLRPDRRILELPSYLLQALFLAIVLKETPEARRYARRGL